ncbi:unnamed protein product [Sphagnum jensenii]|uniref:FAD-binding domain-containing protein n=1 Tax=Sphagnum jensenii TaxID=128206 RepID=A0ABP1BSA3_9BRYO
MYLSSSHSISSCCSFLLASFCSVQDHVVTTTTTRAKKSQFFSFRSIEFRSRVRKSRSAKLNPAVKSMMKSQHEPGIRRERILETEVAIVGGGLGGLACAVGLQERGIKTHVFEKATTRRHHSGTAISIAENGITALEGIQLGLSLKMRKVGSDITNLELSKEYPGKQEEVVEWTRKPGEIFMIPWKMAQYVLGEQLDPQLIHWGHTFHNYRHIEGSNGVEAYFTVDGDEDQAVVVRAKLLVGADGMHSVIRKQMIGDDARYLSLVDWNCIILNPDSRVLKLHKKDQIRYVKFGPSIVGFLTDAGSDYTLWHIRLPDENGELSEAFKSDFHEYGESAKKMRVLKGLAKLKSTFKETDKMSFLKSLEEAINITEAGLVREGKCFDRLPLTSWIDPNSAPVVVIADAAHGMHATPGQGARTAFEDAHQLNLLLDEVFNGPNEDITMEKALKRFDQIRVPRLTKMQSYAAETTYFDKFTPEWVLNLPQGEREKRAYEFAVWISAYPDKMHGDPDSTYWKP